MFPQGKKENANFEDRFSRVVDFAQVMLNYHFRDSQRHFAYVRYVTKALCLRYNQVAREPFSDHELRLIYIGATLHDIGLISIPDRLLNMKGPLRPEDRDRYESHAQTGANIVDQMAGIYHLTPSEQEVLHNICLCHHERYDGGGYPNHLKGDETPVYAQIVSIAEVYDSLTAKNYSEPRTHEEAIELILSGACGAFNPCLLECLRQASTDVQALWECRDDDDRVELLYDAIEPTKKSYWLQKRALDVVASSMALLVLSPLMALIALVIWLDDPKGSPIFRQVRVGRHKKEFTMFKFRTMHVDAELRKQELEGLNEKDGPVFKIANDPRITRVGRFLRKTSLDELPQLVNVLRGDMSLVGPRPALPSEVLQYSRFAEMRLSVTPGITCVWQTQSRRDDVTFDQWMNMDIAYIGTRSFSQDVKLILQTVKTVLTRSGN